MIHQEGTTVVFQWTTPQDIRLVVEELIQRHSEVRVLFHRASMQAGVVHPDLDKLDKLDNALENVLADLECDGYEREEAPRYNRWLDT